MFKVLEIYDCEMKLLHKICACDKSWFISKNTMYIDWNFIIKIYLTIYNSQTIQWFSCDIVNQQILIIDEMLIIQNYFILFSHYIYHFSNIRLSMNRESIKGKNHIIQVKPRRYIQNIHVNEIIGYNFNL